MKPTEILESVRKKIPFYYLDAYIDNLKSEGNFLLADAEYSMLSSAISYFAENGSPERTLSIEVPESDGFDENDFEIPFPDEFRSVVQVKDAELQSLAYRVDSVNEVIIVSNGYTGPYEFRYRYKLEDYFECHVTAEGDVVIDINKDITDTNTVQLIKSLLKAKLTDYNKKISEVGENVHMTLPTSEGETQLAEEAIKGQVIIQPSLMSS